MLRSLYKGLPVLFLYFFISSCKTDAPVPSYLHVTSAQLKTATGQGSSKADFKDAWIQVDQDIIGTFELPATIPVLKTGTHKVKIQPGIITNNNPETRNPYQMVNPVIVPNVVLKENEISSLDTISTAYASDVAFDWMEDFDTGAKSIDSSYRSKTEFLLKPDYAYEGVAGGGVEMTESKNVFEIKTKSTYTFALGTVVFLEFHYKSNEGFNIGFIDNTAIGTPLDYYLLSLPSSNDSWKKVYIDLSHISTTVNSDKFNIVFVGKKTSAAPISYVYFDNFKILHIK